MILCDREIEALLEDGAILIEPRPPKEFWTSTAIDLTLDEILLQWSGKAPPSGGPDELRPNSPNFNVQAMMEGSHFAQKLSIGAEGFLPGPGKFILGFTREKIRLPNRSRVAARVEGKSSLARIGIGIHVTAPTIHAGFGAPKPESQGSPIQLEIFNVGPWRVRLDSGMRICQLIFEEVREMPQIGYRGQFSEQTHFKEDLE